MIIIAGLGNPGERYKGTRHNAGFIAVDRIKEEYGFPVFSFSKKANSLISEGTIKNNKAILIKPQTFMNNSGKAVKKIMDYYNIPPSELYLFHDDIDILLGEAKISKESGSAGHKGVESIINEIKTKSFNRIRIGIKPKEKKEETDVFVLKKFSREEKEIINNAIDSVIKLCL